MRGFTNKLSNLDAIHLDQTSYTTAILPLEIRLIREIPIAKIREKIFLKKKHIHICKYFEIGKETSGKLY